MGTASPSFASQWQAREKMLEVIKRAGKKLAMYKKLYRNGEEDE